MKYIDYFYFRLLVFFRKNNYFTPVFFACFTCSLLTTLLSGYLWISIQMIFFSSIFKYSLHVIGALLCILFYLRYKDKENQLQTRFATSVWNNRIKQWMIGVFLFFGYLLGMILTAMAPQPSSPL